MSDTLPHGGSPVIRSIERAVARLALPVGRALALTGLSPNAITVVVALLGLAAGAWIAVGDLSGLAIAALVLALGFFDSLDGAVARRTGRTTQLGAVLDSTLDRLTDGALLLGLLVRALTAGRDLEVTMLAAALVTTPMVSHVRAKAEGLGVACRGGWMTRTIRILVLGAGAAFDRVPAAAGLIAAGCLVTALERLLHLRRTLASRAREPGRGREEVHDGC